MLQIKSDSDKDNHIITVLPKYLSMRSPFVPFSEMIKKLNLTNAIFLRILIQISQPAWKNEFWIQFTVAKKYVLVQKDLFVKEVF